MNRFILSTVSLSFWLASISLSYAGNTCSCGQCGSECASQGLVKKTIMVPCVITETRLKSCVVKRNVEKEETYTVFRRVPVKRKFEKETCYLEDEVKTQTIEKKRCRQVENPVVRDYAVNVPVTEIREGVRQREVCTDCGKVCIEEPCSCTVTRMQRGMRSTNYCEKDVVFETTKKEIAYCVKTPKMHKELCAEETVYKLEPVEKTRTVTVCVPEIVKTPVDVQVVKMLPKTIYCCEKCAKH